MPDRIRVLQVIKTLNISGAERFGLELACALDPTQFDVQLCAFFQENQPVEKYWYDQLAKRGIKAWFAADWQGNNHFGTYLQGLSQLDRRLQSWQVDIVHSHFQLGTLSGLFVRSRNHARRVIRTAHNQSRKEWDPGLYGWLRYQVFSHWVYPMGLDAQVGVSEAIVAELREHPGERFARRKAQVIYNAIPSDLVLRARQIPRNPKQEDRFIIGSIGRLSEQKGYIYLLETIPLLLSTFPNLECWFIGDGDLRDSLEKQTGFLGIQDRVRFLGRQSEVLPWLRQMDLFVLPSLWEGLPTVILESMAAETPVIATDIPGTRELVQNGVTGWLVPARDPHALGSAITHALQSPVECESVCRNALEKLSIFSIGSVADQYSALYQELAHGGKHK